MKRRNKLKRSNFNKRMLRSKSFGRQMIFMIYRGYGEFSKVFYKL
jgi:hypothetical protein